jgi:hypothetical protein
MTRSVRTAVPALAAAYARHAARVREGVRPDPDFWAFDEVNSRVRWGGDPEDAWDIVTAVVRGAADEDLGYVCAVSEL